MEKQKKGAPWDEEGVAAGRFDAFREIVAALRSDNGCPWDREQTLESLKPCLIDEAVEALGAVEVCSATGDSRNLCEELGDVLLLVVLLTQIAEDEGLFDMEDVICGISRKMIRRHPHVFGTEAAAKCMPEKAAEPEKTGEWERYLAAERTADTERTDSFLSAEGIESGSDSGEAYDLWTMVKRVEKQCYTEEELKRQKDAVKAASAWAAEYLI